jgi:hypothetical protein
MRSLEIDAINIDAAHRGLVLEAHHRLRQLHAKWHLRQPGKKFEIAVK